LTADRPKGLRYYDETRAIAIPMPGGEEPQQHQADEHTQPLVSTSHAA
jgi:hypothetical protein